MRHVFSCLVHEQLECVVDLVRNLQFFDPDSTVLLYDGSGGSLLQHASEFEEIGAAVHPAPKRMHWGRLHESVYDCLEYALEHHAFDAVTFVDSDQLLTGRGYGEAVRATLERQPAAGLLGTPNPAIGDMWATEHEANERKLWKPFLARFPRGNAHEYPRRWIFWPGTVITGAAAAALCDLRRDPVLADILERSNFCSEEIGFATAAAALGYKLAAKPWNDDWVRWRRPIRVPEVAEALADPDCFWLHPVVRRIDDESRTYLRRASNDYQGFTPTFSARPHRPPARTRLKRRATNGCFRVLAKQIDGLAPNEAKAALARARRAQ